MLSQILGKQPNGAPATATQCNHPALTAINSNLSSVSSAGSEIDQIPGGSEFPILTTSRFTLSLRLLDKILYLRSDDSGSNVTPLRGYLCIYVKKPARISHIRLQFEGSLNLRLFPKGMMPDPNSAFVIDQSVSIFSQSRSWQYRQNDKVLDTDYFTKGSFAYPFQFLIPNEIPETMSNVFGSTSYSITVNVNYFSSSLTKVLSTQTKITQPLPIQLVQCDSESCNASLTSSDALSLGKWRDLLYYKIVVSNRQVAIGGSLKFYIKVLPINSLGYKLNSIRVYLDQVTEYHVADRLTEEEKELYHANLTNTERILLEEVNLNLFENEIQTWEFDALLKKVHKKYKAKDDNCRGEVVLVPTTNRIENKVCHFSVTHKVKVAISVEEVSHMEDTASLDLSDLASSFSMRTRSQSMDKSLSHTRAEKAENRMIKQLAKLLIEPETKKSKVELILEADVAILKGESVDGKMPPPTYSDAQQQKHEQHETNFTVVPSKVFTLLDTKKLKQRPQLNFIVPPAYEEIEEESQPPPYICNL